MANADAAFGFRPVRMLDGSPWNGAVIRATVAAADADVVAIGDAVEAVTTGAILYDNYSSANQDSAFPIVSRCDGVGDRPWGIVVSVEANRADLETVTTTASTDQQVLICPTTHDVVFEVQNSAALALTAVHGCFNMVVGAPSNGRSIMEIDSTTLGTTGVWRLIGFRNDPCNVPTDANAICEVVCAESAWGDTGVSPGLA